MPPAAAPAWLLVQRADADPADRDRVDDLATRLGDDATIRRTDDVDALDTALASADGRVVVVCGGDGSIHHAVDRLSRRGGLDETTVALFPAGTGNDLAHTLALPLDPSEMADVLRTGHVGSLDVLAVGDDGDVAVNALHAGIGVDAAERSQDLPDGLGALAYPLGALLAGMRADGFAGEVTVDGTVVRPEADHDATLMVLVCNGRTIGGGHELAPGADPGDGRLDVVVSHAVGPAARAAFGVAVTRGTHVERDDVAVATGEHVRITGPGLTWNVDGELWLDRPVDALDVRVRPGALRMVLPGT